MIALSIFQSTIFQLKLFGNPLKSTELSGNIFK